MLISSVGSCTGTTEGCKIIIKAFENDGRLTSSVGGVWLKLWILRNKRTPAPPSPPSVTGINSLLLVVIWVACLHEQIATVQQDRQPLVTKRSWTINIKPIHIWQLISDITAVRWHLKTAGPLSCVALALGTSFPFCPLICVDVRTHKLCNNMLLYSVNLLFKVFTSFIFLGPELSIFIDSLP